MNSNETNVKKFKLLPVEEHLYDQYASDALTGLVIGRNSSREGYQLFVEAYSKTGDDIQNHAEAMAVRAFDIAEAMIMERRVRKGTTIPHYSLNESTSDKYLS